MERTLQVAPRKKASTAKATPTPEQIQLRAYEIFLERHGAPGNPLEDWLRAERELVPTSPNRARKSAGSQKSEAA
jgi:hypothetical protein